MSLTVKRKKANKIPPMAGGNYMAVVVGLIDVGEQYSDRFKNYTDKLIIIFEIPSETVEVDGEQNPRWLSKDFSATLNEKSNLYKTLVSFLGRDLTESELSEDGTGFDLTSLVGQGCILTVTLDTKEDGDQKNSIKQIGGLPAGIPAPHTESDLLIFDIDNRDESVFEKLPEWIQERIKKSTQYQADLPDKPLENPAAEQAQKPGACPI